MNIAMVEQSRVDEYVDRVQRFVQNVHELADRLKEALAERTTEREETTGITGDTMKESVTQSVSETSATDTSHMSAASVVTDDDVDIDALLNDLSLNDDHHL